MKFDEPEVIEMGMADELVKDEFDLDTSESIMPSRIKIAVAMYVADTE